MAQTKLILGTLLFSTTPTITNHFIILFSTHLSEVNPPDISFFKSDFYMGTTLSYQ